MSSGDKSWDVKMGEYNRPEELGMTRSECIHILRNPYGHSAEEVKQAQLFACNEIEMLEEAYLNMRDWAEKNGVNTVCRTGSSSD